MTNKVIHFWPENRAVVVKNEGNVLEVALANAIALSHSCGGMGSCTTCRVWVESCAESLPPRSELEQDIADMRHFAPQERLACQLPPLEGLVVRIPDLLAD